MRALRHGLLVLWLIQAAGCEPVALAAAHDWTISGSFTPTTGSWAPGSAQLIFALSPGLNVGPAYCVRCSVANDLHAGAKIVCELVFPGDLYSRIYFTLGAGIVNTPGAGTTHKIALSCESGLLRVYWDDVQIDYQTDYLGRVTPRSIPTAYGAVFGSGFSNTGFAVTAAAYPNSATKTRYNILWLGDSIYLNWNELQDFSGRLFTDGYQATYSLAAYGSNNMGNGFLELSDEIWAYERGAWAQKTRWKPLSSYDFCSFNYLANEMNTGTPLGMTVAEYIRGYDKIVSLATRSIPRTVMAASMPQANGALNAWVYYEPQATAQAQLGAIATKYNIPFVNYWSVFPANSPAPYTIAQLMRETVHPTQNKGDAGIVLMADTIYPYFNDVITPNAAAPTIVGDVITYLWGRPTAGSWTMTTAEQVTNTYPGESALYRVAKSRDQANVAAVVGAKLEFPTAPFEMLYLHTLGAGTSGAFDVIVDRGLATEYRKSFVESASGNYPRSFFVRDAFSTSFGHTVEVETTSANAAYIVGVSYVGVP